MDDINTLSFESALQQLEQIIKLLERGDCEIEKLCRDDIDQVINESEYVILPLPVTYDNKNLFYDKNDPMNKKEESLWPTSRADAIRKMFNYPSAEILEQGLFEQINIAELLLCINNAKDDTRHTENRSFLAMTSTSRKVINILLLGRILDGEDENGSFVVLEKKATEQYRDTHQVLYNYFTMVSVLQSRQSYRF